VTKWLSKMCLYFFFTVYCSEFARAQNNPCIETGPRLSPWDCMWEGIFLLNPIGVAAYPSNGVVYDSVISLGERIDISATLGHKKAGLDQWPIYDCRPSPRGERKLDDGSPQGSFSASGPYHDDLTEHGTFSANIVPSQAGAFTVSLRGVADFGGCGGRFESVVKRKYAVTHAEFDPPFIVLRPGAQTNVKYRVTPSDAESYLSFHESKHPHLFNLVKNGGEFSVTARKHGATGIVARHDGHKMGEVQVKIFDAKLVADWNHDRVINTVDYAVDPSSNVYHFWVNDDDDHGVDSGNDIPGSGSKDGGNSEVDSVRDLVDFFPVYVDLAQAIYVLGTTDFTYALQHNQGGMGFVYTDLTPGNAGAYLTDKATAERVAGQTVNRISGSGNGFVLDDDFLTGIRWNGIGVILVEASLAGSGPLILNIMDSSGNVVFSTELDLSITGVEDMYRQVNISYVFTGPVALTPWLPEPSNMPDSESNGKNLVFVHGFNVSPEEARGWHAEMFKRLYWSGSNAKFMGITWDGDTGKNYHKAVINAFQASSKLKYYLSSLMGDTVIAAHSLGNVVVSEAIANHGLRPEKYFMFNAAMPIEAFDAGQQTTAEGLSMRDNMTNPKWVDYDERLWASEWYDLFSAGDNRSKLTWRNRYAEVPSKTAVHNYYSSGENVLANGDGDIPSTMIDLKFNDGRLAWVFQEMVKGRDGTLATYNLVMPDQHAGWQFNGEAYDANSLLPTHQVMKPADTTNITDEALMLEPFFERFVVEGKEDGYWWSPYDGSALYGLDGDADASRQAGYSRTQYKLLGEAVPALSFAVGANSVEDIEDPVRGGRNVDMQSKKTGWPKKSTEWEHSDMKNIAYPYVHKIFDDVVTAGSLR